MFLSVGRRADSGFVKIIVPLLLLVKNLVILFKKEAA